MGRSGASARAPGRRAEPGRAATGLRPVPPGSLAPRAAPPVPLAAGAFLCDVVEAVPKDDLGSMEHPMFSLSTRPDLRILRYERKGVTVEVTPSVRGLATIHDKDVLIYATSQLVAALNAGRPVSRTLQITAHDLLAATSREASGDGYRRLREALERLAGTRITTNLVTGGEEVTEGFGLIESWRIVRKARGGRMVSVSLTLSDWLYRAILARSVLTLSRDYFGLRKPVERRVYEIARKHCGRQPAWAASVATLHEKSGSASPLRVFRRMLRDMIAADVLPDYRMVEDGGDVIRFRPRLGAGAEAGAPPPALSSETMERARLLAPRADVHALAAEWQAAWRATGSPRLHAPDRAFLGWIEARRARKG